MTKTYVISLEVDVSIVVEAEDLDNAISQAKRAVRADLRRHSLDGFALLDHECEGSDDDEAD